LTARTLYYEEPADKDQLPSIPAAKSQQARKTSQAQGSGAAANPAAQKVLVAGKQSSGTNTALGTAKNQGVQSGYQGASIPAVKHLGLRYNLLLVDAQSGQSEPVDSDRVFQPGECVALELEANRSGYLYVLDRGSSGTWNPLLPSPEMPEESNIVGSRRLVRVPQNYCFKIEGPPGEERVFVVLSRNPAELYGLDESIKSGVPSATPAPQSHEGTPLMTAENRVSYEVSKMEASMERRDLKITKIGQPKDAAEPSGSVYVVNASEVSSYKVVTEIRIRHN
jgi:hypothetical protein